MTDPDEYIDDPEDDDEGEYQDCGLLPDGQCMKAGSEECDWDCPHSHGPHYAGSEAWHRLHDKGVPVCGCECLECVTARKKSNQATTP